MVPNLQHKRFFAKSCPPPPSFLNSLSAPGPPRGCTVLAEGWLLPSGQSYFFNCPAHHESSRSHTKVPGKSACGRSSTPHSKETMPQLAVPAADPTPGRLTTAASADPSLVIPAQPLSVTSPGSLETDWTPRRIPGRGGLAFRRSCKHGIRNSGAGILLLLPGDGSELPTSARGRGLPLPLYLLYSCSSFFLSTALLMGSLGKESGLGEKSSAATSSFHSSCVTQQTALLWPRWGNAINWGPCSSKMTYVFVLDTGAAGKPTPLVQSTVSASRDCCRCSNWG